MINNLLIIILALNFSYYFSTLDNVSHNILREYALYYPNEFQVINYLI